MDQRLLILCNGFSCFIISTILFQFMNRKYKRSIPNKYRSLFAKAVIVGIILCIHFVNNAMLNLLAWGAAAAIASYFLYDEEIQKPFRRILESEALALCMWVCEALGVILFRWILQLADVGEIDGRMLSCLEVMFSKILLIFLYAAWINENIKRGEVSDSKTYYMIYGIMLAYSLIHIIVMVENLRNGQKSYFCAVNMGGIVLADFSLLYFVKMAEEKSDYEKKSRELEQQAKIQYEYYLAQNKKYDQTVQILHDVNKHMKAMEGLYRAGQEHTADKYAKEIGDMLKPLIPVRYTENPILDILLTDKEAVMKERGITAEIKVDHVDLGFLAPIDVTTIFGNLLDNAIEAAEKGTGDRYIHIRIASYHQMIVVRMENSCNGIKWKHCFPISDKGKDRGIGLLNVQSSIEKYNGNLTLKQEENKFIVELFLNS